MEKELEAKNAKEGKESGEGNTLDTPPLKKIKIEGNQEKDECKGMGVELSADQKRIEDDNEQKEEKENADKDEKITEEENPPLAATDPKKTPDVSVKEEKTSENSGESKELNGDNEEDKKGERRREGGKNCSSHSSSVDPTKPDNEQGGGTESSSNRDKEPHSSANNEIKKSPAKPEKTLEEKLGELEEKLKGQQKQKHLLFMNLKRVLLEEQKTKQKQQEEESAQEQAYIRARASLLKESSSSADHHHHNQQQQQPVTPRSSTSTNFDAVTPRHLTHPSPATTPTSPLRAGGRRPPPIHLPGFGARGVGPSIMASYAMRGTDILSPCLLTPDSKMRRGIGAGVGGGGYTPKTGGPGLFGSSPMHLGGGGGGSHHRHPQHQPPPPHPHRRFLTTGNSSTGEDNHNRVSSPTAAPAESPIGASRPPHGGGGGGGGEGLNSRPSVLGRPSPLIMPIGLGRVPPPPLHPMWRSSAMLHPPVGAGAVGGGGLRGQIFPRPQFMRGNTSRGMLQPSMIGPPPPSHHAAMLMGRGRGGGGGGGTNVPRGRGYYR